MASDARRDGSKKEYNELVRDREDKYWTATSIGRHEVLVTRWNVELILILR